MLKAHQKLGIILSRLSVAELFFKYFLKSLQESADSFFLVDFIQVNQLLRNFKWRTKLNNDFASEILGVIIVKPSWD